MGPVRRLSPLFTPLKLTPLSKKCAANRRRDKWGTTGTVDTPHSSEAAFDDDAEGYIA